MKNSPVPAGRRFLFRPVLTLCVALALGVLVALGTWQLQRLEWKRDLIAKVEERVTADPIPFEEAVRRAEAGEDMEYAPVTLTGDFHFERTARVFGAYGGTPGIFSFTPMQTDAGGAVYVNRGFIPQSVETSPPPETEQATVSGLLRYAESLSPPASWFRSAEQSVGGLWFVRDPRLFTAKAGVKASPYYVDQFAVPGREWPKGGTTRLAFSNRHLEYALTWYGLALALVGVWVAFSLQKR